MSASAPVRPKVVHTVAITIIIFLSCSSRGVRDDLHMGMTALSASISAVNQETKDGTKAVLDKLVELRDSQHHDQQLAYLERAVNAIGDLTSKMYAPGNPKNVDLLLKASNNAEEAARSPRGSFTTKLQAYRLWVVTEYLHEVTTAKGECFLAKNTAMIILGRVIIRDPDILKICRKYSSPRSRSRKEPPAPELVTPDGPEESGWSSRSGDYDLPEEVSEAMEFLFDIVSSVIMLPPLDKEVACLNLLTANATGSLTVGAEVPHDVIFAMGRYCAAIPRVARAYPAVSSVALEAWNAGKEELALNNFFVSMSGDDWIVRNGWMSEDVALGDRFGITVENGHVTKISLATNNLQGCLTNDLVDCEHLRELVLHGNGIFGVVPPKLQRFIDSKRPGMVVTGMPERGATPPVLPPPRGVPDFRTIGPGDTSVYSTPTITGTPQSGERHFSFSRKWASHSGIMGEEIAIHSKGHSGIPREGVAIQSKGLKKKTSFFKKAGRLLKTAIASDFDAGFAIKCPQCSGKMTSRGSQLVCPHCNLNEPESDKRW